MDATREAHRMHLGRPESLTLDWLSRCDVPILARISIGSVVEPGSGCWIWNGRLSSSGYGRISFDGKDRLIHRIAHELLIGPIPEGFHVDHVLARGCTHRNCWNPAHLEAVEPQENLARIVNDNNRGALTFANRRTCGTCSRGHDMTDPANVYQQKEGEGCRLCRSEKERERRAKDGGKHASAQRERYWENIESSRERMRKKSARPWSCPICGKQMKYGDSSRHKKKLHSGEPTEGKPTEGKQA